MTASSYGDALYFSNTDLHENFQFTKVNATVRATNFSDSPVRLRAIDALRSTDKVVNFPNELAGGLSANISLEISTDDDAGAAIHGFRIHLDDGVIQLLQIKNFGLTMLDVSRAQANLGSVKSGEASAWLSTDIESTISPELRIEKIIDAPDFVQARIAADARHLETAVKPDASWGYHQGFVHIALNAQPQTEAVVEVQADIRGKIIPDENPMVLGIVRRGSQPPHLLRLSSVDDSPVNISQIEVSGLKAKTEKRSCEPKAKSCQIVAVTIDDSQPTGRFSGTMRIKFDKGENLTVADSELS